MSITSQDHVPVTNAVAAPVRRRISPEDAVAAGGLFLLFIVSFPSAIDQSDHWHTWSGAQPTVVGWLLGTTVAACMAGALVWRRVNPPLMLALVAVGGLAHLAVFTQISPLMLTVPLAVYAVGRWGSNVLVVVALVIGAASSAAAAANWLWPDLVPQAVALVSLVCLAVVVVGLLLGRSVRSRAAAVKAEILAGMQSHQTQLDSRHRAVVKAQTQQRAVIARELHDVVAHSLAVMVLQAEGGQAQAAKCPQAASEALSTIATVGREAIEEMRHIVGVLRSDKLTSPDGVVLQHVGLADIPAMVAKAGPRVSFQVTGAVPVVPAPVAEATYRVTQESLTNFIKHAGPTAKATVHLCYRDDGITIAVTDDGRGGPTTSSSKPGNGLAGMAERVGRIGGQLSVGPVDKGFQVRAFLPLDGQPKQEAVS